MVAAFLSTNLFAQKKEIAGQEKYSQVRISTTSENDMKRLTMPQDYSLTTEI